MKLVLDSNVIIAGFLSHGLAADILELAVEQDIEIVSSDKILEEVKSKLIGKLKLQEGYVTNFTSHLKKNLTIVTPVKKVTAIKQDPSDNKILECALAAKADLVVTMDKHLLKLKKFEHFGIIHPKTLTWILPKLLA